MQLHTYAFSEDFILTYLCAVLGIYSKFADKSQITQLNKILRTELM